MDELSRLLGMARTRNVLKDIVEQNRRRMPCGDSRIAERLRSLGAVRLVDPKQREITTSWIATELGLKKYERRTNV